ncbi:MAG: hypothetical protein AABX83_01930 [Nanoarchaeota archaeon]
MIGHTYSLRETLNIFFETKKEIDFKELEGKILFAEDEKILPFSLIIRPTENPIYEISDKKYRVVLPEKLIEDEKLRLNGLSNHTHILEFRHQKFYLINVEKLVEQEEENHYLELYKIVKDKIRSNRPAL